MGMMRESEHVLERDSANFSLSLVRNKGGKNSPQNALVFPVGEKDFG